MSYAKRLQEVQDYINSLIGDKKALHIKISNLNYILQERNKDLIKFEKIIENLVSENESLLKKINTKK